MQPGSVSTWATGKTARAGCPTLSVPVATIFPGPAAVVNVPSNGRRFATSRAVAVIDTGVQAVSAISLEERADEDCVAKTAGRTFIFSLSSAHSGESFQLRLRSPSLVSQSAAPWPSRPQRKQTMGLRAARGGAGAAAAVCTGTAAGAAGTEAADLQAFDALCHRLQLEHIVAFSGAFAGAVAGADAGAGTGSGALCTPNALGGGGGRAALFATLREIISTCFRYSAASLRAGAAFSVASSSARSCRYFVFSAVQVVECTVARNVF